jgi:hypothetical protein
MGVAAQETSTFGGEATGVDGGRTLDFSPLICAFVHSRPP